MFKNLFGGSKKDDEKRRAEEEARKREVQRQAPSPQPRRRTGKYDRLAAWIKSNYGNYFRDGQTSDEVKMQLDRVLRELESSGSLSEDAKRGFRTFIETRQYRELVKVRE